MSDISIFKLGKKLGTVSRKKNFTGFEKVVVA